MMIITAAERLPMHYIKNNAGIFVRNFNYENLPIKEKIALGIMFIYAYFLYKLYKGNGYVEQKLHADEIDDYQIKFNSIGLCRL